MTGEELLQKLQALTPEQRALPLYLHGDIQDGYTAIVRSVTIESPDTDDAGDPVPAHLRLNPH